MTLPISTNNATAESAAKTLYAKLKTAHNMVLQAQTDLAVNQYNTLVDIPRHSKMLADTIAEIQSAGTTNQVLAIFADYLPEAVTLSDVTAFKSAFESLAADVETNAGLFLLSIHPTEKTRQFVTPVSTAVRNAITSRINAILATVA
jgi:hypothetical protein